MSINALTNAALARRHDFAPVSSVPRNLTEIAHAAGTPPEPAGAPASPPRAPASPANGPNTALQTLTTYIPTEVLTLYVSAIAAVGPLTVNGVPVGRWLPFWCFLVATNTPFAQFESGTRRGWRRSLCWLCPPGSG
jgi:hypothetical protein